MTPIDAKKDAMGYKTITMRPRCGACADVSSSPLDLRLTCGRGGFVVTSMSVCDQYRPRGAQAPARQASECPATPFQSVPVRSKGDAGATPAARGLRASKPGLGD